jgi:hypothetical protein
MSNYLLPTDDVFLDDVAKAIAKNRLLSEAEVIIDEMIPAEFDVEDALDTMFTPIFERLWAGTSEHDKHQRKMYREDARIAIAAINLKLLTLDQ